MIYIEGYDSVIELNNGQSLLKALGENGIFLTAPCGGLGSCGKCRIQIIEGYIPASDWDQKHLTQKEIENGVRLACKIFGNVSAKIRLLSYENDMKILSYEENTFRDDFSKGDLAAGKGCVIAIDLGTTTIAGCLIDYESGNIISSNTGINHQRIFGSDVISRINAANQGEGPALTESVKEDLRQLIEHLIDTIKQSENIISRIAIAGNTTMVSLLMGYPVNNLGAYPFKAHNLETIYTDTVKLFGLKDRIDIVIFPGISAFVGGDITSGLLALDFDKSHSLNAFIDLGTNAEMAVGNRNGIMVTSAAAGPAFEGGNISWGRASTAGSICHAYSQNGRLMLKTIDNKPMTGICGSGILSLMSELLKNGVVDKEGRLDDVYGKSGYPLGRTIQGERVTFTQNDIRQLQLAKASIRAGFEILLKNYGAEYQDIDKIYIAGGFGSNIDSKWAVDIGMLDEKLLPKIVIAYNTSLKGCRTYLLSENGDERLKAIRAISKEVVLSLDPDFNDVYLRAMNFHD